MNFEKPSVQAREAGGMTQHIGASFFPVETLKQLIGPYMGNFKTGIEIPGLLIVDTPGHEGLPIFDAGAEASPTLRF